MFTLFIYHFIPLPRIPWSHRLDCTTFQALLVPSYRAIIVMRVFFIVFNQSMPWAIKVMFFDIYYY